MTVLITLTSAGADTGPFNLYSNLDGYVTPFETGVSKGALLGGYTSIVVPDYTTTIQIKSEGVCINFINVEVVYPTTTTTTTAVLPVCGTSIPFPGGISYPTTLVINEGADLGTVTLNYDPSGIPDLFVLEFEGSIVADSGYSGAAIYDFSGPNRSDFIAALNGLTDPILGGVYPNITNYPDDGYPRVTGGGAPGSISFYKGTTTPNVTVKVYAPISATGWTFLLNCPVPLTTTSTTTV